MGSVFGKQTVAEPAFDLLAKQTAGFSYELRRYGTRFAAEVHYSPTGSGDDDGSPFRLLAQYIGVFGTPDNQGQQAISMTAPVVKQEDGGAVKLAMTAPVVKTNDESSGSMMMQFILPADYTSLDQIPKPNNPAVHIAEIAPAVGAVHRYSGSFDDDKAAALAQDLALHLLEDGVDDLGDTTWVSSHYQFWGYNPPFTLPPFRRNEVWIPLTEVQAERLMQGFNTESAN